MRPIAWMALQIAIVAAAVWLEYDMAPLHNRAPNLGAGVAMGIVFAFIITGSLVVVRDKLLVWRSRRDLAAGLTTALGRQRGEPAREIERFAATGGGSSESAKLIGGSRVREQPRNLI